MKTLRYISLIVFVLLTELFLSAMLTLRAVNLAKYPYRREQRYAALKAYESDRSIQKEAAYQHELEMASRHFSHRQLMQTAIVFSVFLIADGIFLFSRKKKCTS